MFDLDNLITLSSSNFFFREHALDKVIILWTANTERFADVVPGLNDTAESLMRSIKNDAGEISPSTLFAVASILEGVSLLLLTIVE